MVQIFICRNSGWARTRPLLLLFWWLTRLLGYYVGSQSIKEFPWFIASLKAFLLTNVSDFHPYSGLSCSPCPLHTVGTEWKSLTWPLQQTLSLGLFESNRQTLGMVKGCDPRQLPWSYIAVTEGKGKPACLQSPVNASPVLYNLQLETSAAN